MRETRRSTLDVVRIGPRVADERRDARARDAPVDALVRRLLDEQELVDHLRERAFAGDEPQHPVGVEPLDRDEVERERAMQLVDEQLDHLANVVRRSESRRQPRGETQLRADSAGFLTVTGCK